MARKGFESSNGDTPPRTIRLEEATLFSDQPRNVVRYSPTFFSQTPIGEGLVAPRYLSAGMEDPMAEKNVGSYTAVKGFFDHPTKENYYTAVTHLLSMRTLASAKQDALYTYIDDTQQAVRKRTDIQKAVTRKVLLQNSPENPYLKSLVTKGVFAHNVAEIESITETHSISPEELAKENSRLRLGLDVISADTTTQFGVNALRALNRQITGTLSSTERARLEGNLTLLDQSKTARQRRPKFALHSPQSYTDVVDKRFAIVAATLETVTTDSSYPDNLNEFIKQAKEITRLERIIRMGYSAVLLNGKVTLETIPSNVEMYTQPNLSLFNPPREEIKLRTAEEIAGDIKFRKQIRDEQQAQRKDQEVAIRQGLIEEETPLIEGLNDIATEHAALLAPFRNQTSRYLRAKGLIGANSIDYRLRQSKVEAPLGFEPYIRVYDGLSQFVDSHEEYIDDFEQLTEEEKRLREAYMEALNARIFKSGLRPNVLQTDLSQDIEWLRKNWGQFTSYISGSEHRNRMNAETLAKVKALLFKDLQLVEESTEAGETTEITFVEEPVETPTEAEIYIERPVVEWSEEELLELAEMEREERERASVSREELVKANELFEQLNWIVLPDQKITSDELIQIAKQTLAAHGKTNSYVDHARMVDLLQFRDAYGGTLYRSAERMLGDSNNLYFVLKFTHPGDDNIYAIAENIVYGNATYVLREDILPLMEGETVLTAVKLSRKVVKDLGAKRLPHLQNASKTHSERITDSLIELSNA